MTKQTGLKTKLLVVITCLISCSGDRSTSDTNTRDLELMATSVTMTPQTTLRAEMSMPYPAQNETSITTVTAPMEPPAPNIDANKFSCPGYVRNQLPLWSQGSILYGKGRLFNQEQVHNVAVQPGIWAISANSSQTQLVHDHASWVSISSDGTTLLSVVQDAGNNTQEIVLHNLLNGEETHITEPDESYLFMELWLSGRVQYGRIVERTEEVGQKRILLVPDSETGTVEKFIKEIELPGFAFNAHELERGLFYGYESIDPTGELILYTAQKGNGDNFEVRLLNLETGEILWQHDTQYLPGDVPQWSEDGSRVLFVVNIPLIDTQSGWWKIISLTREGEIEALPTQPLPFTEEGRLNYYSRSPDGRYLFYIAWEVDIQTLNSRNRAFIVDVITGEIGEICDSEATFIASVPAGGNLTGHWLPHNQFAYPVLIEKGGQLAHSLRVLDIPSWTVQIVLEADPGYGVNIFGWTSVEFP